MTRPNSAGAAVGCELTGGFNNTYELRAENAGASADALVCKILAECRSGLYLWDVLVGLEEAVDKVVDYRAKSEEIFGHLLR